MEILKSKKYNALLSATAESNRAIIEELSGTVVLITGATGMIGSCVTDLLMKANELFGLNCHVIATGRSKERLEKRFGAYLDNDLFTGLSCDVMAPLGYTGRIDYIIHAASNADPANFAKCPVDTMLANITGTYNLLEYSRKNAVKRFLFVSSGEFYGSSENIPDGFRETDLGKLDYSNSRICYPEGKRSAEALCKCYEKQYDTDTVIVRPCHIFGPTMTSSDSRAVSQFFRNAAASLDIVLNSPGNIERSQCYVADAATGILTVLINGDKGEAYNISDMNLVMTIRKFAAAVAEAAGRKLIFNNPSDEQIYEPIKEKRQVLVNSKLLGIGWNIPESDKIQETVDILKEML